MLKWWGSLILVAVATTASAQLGIFFAPGLLPPVINSTGSGVIFGSPFSSDTTNLYFVNADGSGLRQLTKFSTGGPDNVSASPDGRWIAYTSGFDVHFVDTTSTTDRLLFTSNGGDCPDDISCESSVHVLDDGSAVLYEAPKTYPFYVIKSDGSQVNLPIYWGTLALPGHRVVSRSGKVVFTSTQVYTMNLDGSALLQVTHLPSTAYPRDATISADGSLIAFTANAPGGTIVYTVRSDGFALSDVASGNVYSPSLSADGSHLAYIDSGQAIVLNLTGSIKRTVLTGFEYSAVNGISISDDGAHVSYAVGSAIRIGILSNQPILIPVAAPLLFFEAGGAQIIYIANVDGSQLREVHAPRELFTPLYPAASPGSIATVDGINLTNDALGSASSLPLPSTLAGVSLLLDGVRLALSSVNAGAISFQVPPGLAEGEHTVQAVLPDGGTTNTSSLTVLPVTPSILIADYVSIGPQATVLHGNTAVLADPAHPAVAGEVLVMYTTGLGDTTPLLAPGVAAPANPPAVTVATPHVSVGGRAATVLFSGAAPGFVGLYQINFVLPSGLRAGTQTMSLNIAGVADTSGSAISVK